MTKLVDQSRLGPYVDLHLLDQGGMGKVYLAYDSRLLRQVAIKKLIHHHDSQLRQRLRREATTLAQLNHPNIVQIYDIVDDDAMLAIVMEYINGQNIKKYVREHIVGLRQRLQWIAQIASGLQAAHNKGLIHRDLKAENILINGDGIAKITDFGIVKNTLNSETEYTVTGQLVGTYSALSPEQALGRPLDARSDLFALGILAFRLLCACHPFGSSDNPMVLVQNILHHDPLDIVSLNPDLPLAVQHLVKQMLAKDPEQRPVDAISVYDHICEIIALLPPDNDNADNTETRAVGLDYASSSDIVAAYGLANSYSPSSAPLFKSSFGTYPHLSDAKSTLMFQRKHLLFTTFFLLVVVALSATAYVYFLQPATPLYVAILPPTINQESAMTKPQQQLLLNTVSDALEQGVLKTRNLYLISPLEVAKTQGTYAERARAVAADVLLEATLECEPQRCDIQLSRIQKPADKKDNSASSESEPWVVLQNQQWPIVVDDHYLNIAQGLKRRLSTLFPNFKQAEAYPTTISDDDYHWYISIRHQVMIEGADYKKNWGALLAASPRFSDYDQYYGLLHFLAIALYDETRDETYLDQLERLLMQAVHKFGSSLVTDYWQFDLYLSQQNVERAEQIIAHLETIESDEVTLLVKKSQLSRLTGDYSHSNDFLHRALTLRPNAMLWYELAYNNWLVGENRSAVEALNKVFLYNPNDYYARTLLATIYLSSGQFSESVLQYQMLLEVRPSALNFSNLGLAYELLGDYKAAEAAFTEAVQLAPQQAAYVLNLADILKLRGHKEQSQKYYQLVLSLATPQSLELESQLTMAQAHVQLGDTREALKILHQAFRQSADDVRVLYTAALVNALAGQWLTALEYINQSIDQGLSPVWFSSPWFDGLCREYANEMNDFFRDENYLKQQRNKNSSLRCY